MARVAGDRARDLLALFEAEAFLGAPAGPRPDASRSRQVIAHAPPGKAEPPPDLAIAQPLRSQLPDRVLGHLGQAEAPWHLRISRVGQDLNELSEQVGNVLNAVTFTLFGAILLGPALGELSWQLALYAALSLTLVRMLPVAIAMVGSRARAPTLGSWAGSVPADWPQSCSR
jgi:hypothetical protein